MKRCVFISVLLICTLTAAARQADTTVIAGRPLADRLELKKGEGKKVGLGSVKPAVSGKAAPVKKATPAAKKSSGIKIVDSSRSAVVKTNTAKPSPVKTTTAKTSTIKTSVNKTFPVKTSSVKTSSKAKVKSRKLRKGIGIELFTPLAFKYAILLDVPVEKVADDRLLEVLDHWYGTRYRYGGETRKGIDCSAFTQAFILSYLDHKLPRTADEQYKECKHIKKKKLRQGDLVFFKTRGPKGAISHVGVYLVNDRFVHSAASTGVRISKLNDDYYREKYAGAGRIR
jgi:cell wall-associated NlpC family hydrolase